METIRLNDDIRLFYIEAASYPEGVPEAHERLHALVPALADRRYFGLSRPEGGTIRYKAAAEEMEAGEAARLKCETLVLKKGTYAHSTVYNYLENVPAIASAFKVLLAQPGLDLNGYCVEWYVGGKDVRCMVRLNR